ncbi:YbaB/EbfC family nucleoid-associated protein [uncultured Jatrophihabitans sp.]|uniref:YbaB/EbfC family nucleoid-associated protein n=1 Tax=uncultured Jatrophihabitans sp. TaxID=1610747 RepID=UPI0035CA154F
MATDDVAARLADARHEAHSDDASMTAVVDGSGQVLDIALEPKAMRLSAETLGASIAETVRAAQAAAREALPEALLDTAAPSPDVESLGRLATELGAGAQQRLSDISSTLDRLLARDSTPRTEA